MLNNTLFIVAIATTVTGCFAWLAVAIACSIIKLVYAAIAMTEPAKPFNVQGTPFNFNEIVSSMWNRETHADLHFIAYDDAGSLKHIPAHRFVVCSRSTALKKACESPQSSADMGRGHQRNNNVTTQFQAKVMTQLLRFIYKNELEIAFELIPELLKAADFYDVPELIAECGSSFDAHLVQKKWNTITMKLFQILVSVKNESQTQHMFPDTFRECLRLVEFYADEFVKSRAFLALEENTVHQIVSSDKLDTSETVLLERLLEWAKHESMRNTLDIHQLLTKFMHRIRVETMATLELNQILDKSCPLLGDVKQWIQNHHKIKLAGLVESFPPPRARTSHYKSLMLLTAAEEQATAQVLLVGGKILGQSGSGVRQPLMNLYTYDPNKGAQLSNMLLTKVQDPFPIACDYINHDGETVVVVIGTRKAEICHANKDKFQHLPAPYALGDSERVVVQCACVLNDILYLFSNIGYKILDLRMKTWTTVHYTGYLDWFRHAQFLTSILINNAILLIQSSEEGGCNIFEYIPNTQEFKKHGEMLKDLPPSLGAFSVLKIGKAILISGGINYDELPSYFQPDDNSIKSEPKTNRCYMLDVENTCLRYLPPMNLPRANHKTVLYKGKVLAIGGNKNNYNDVEMFDGVKWAPVEPISSDFKLFSVCNFIL